MPSIRCRAEPRRPYRTVLQLHCDARSPAHRWCRAAGPADARRATSRSRREIPAARAALSVSPAARSSAEAGGPFDARARYPFRALGAWGAGAMATQPRVAAIVVILPDGVLRQAGVAGERAVRSAVGPDGHRRGRRRCAASAMVGGAGIAPGGLSSGAARRCPSAAVGPCWLSAMARGGVRRRRAQAQRQVVARRGRCGQDAVQIVRGIGGQPRGSPPRRCRGCPRLPRQRMTSLVTSTLQLRGWRSAPALRGLAGPCRRAGRAR